MEIRAWRSWAGLGCLCSEILRGLKSLEWHRPWAQGRSGSARLHCVPAAIAVLLLPLLHSYRSCY